jgi:hypothetical protein
MEIFQNLTCYNSFTTIPENYNRVIKYLEFIGCRIICINMIDINTCVIYYIRIT